MATYIKGGPDRRRPTIFRGINEDLAQELGVLRWYPLSLGSAYRDFSKASNLLAPTNVGALGTARGWGAPAFSSASYLDGSAVAELSGVSDFTTHAWCATNVTSSSGGGGGLRYVVSNEVAGNWQFMQRYSPTLGVLQVGTLAGGGFTVNGTSTVVVNRPMAFTMKMEAGTISLHLNGRQEGSAGTGGTTSANTSNIVTIGSDNGFNSRLRQWSGWISDVVVAIRPWTPAQIWMMADPETAWNLYWQPTNRVVFQVSTGSAKNIFQSPIFQSGVFKGNAA